ncbi:MAG: hypothetical protein N0E59_04725 [Candidatus Thiodiazotropha taylori]|nr:hypothetical protein [Candidatus Thiodiazotropha taylori]MCG8097049.1 hypothetical protein [Candidatus Thiodiazotropha endolucinida]MCG8110045.1 hypothetical protein [Candidatus Thiodiazotropha taylori]MCW4280356.1 hypothetical protein [Candidatus Thiodiazotropha taylori]MCW4282391.1 hypothetical protein [Candidatus Thiodiazotropha taylori]
MKISEETKLKKSIQEGYEAGYKEGLIKSEEDLNLKFESFLTELINNISINRIETDQEIIELACEVINKIASNIKPNEMLQSMAVSAINKLQNKRELQINVNPQHVEELQKTIRSLNHNGTDEYFAIDVRPDKTLGQLDIIIKSQSGETIASFSDQLNLIRDNMLDELSNHSNYSSQT